MPPNILGGGHRPVPSYFFQSSVCDPELLVNIGKLVRFEVSELEIYIFITRKTMVKIWEWELVCGSSF